jgi:hypothetical protein
MTTEQKIIRVKVGLLELAKQLGNVSQACKMMGYRESMLRVLVRRTASSLNSRVNFRLSMTHLQLHQKHLTRCLRNGLQARSPSTKAAGQSRTLS